jgi:hypothetical protein
MPTKILITLAVIIGIGVGVGMLVCGVLLLVFGHSIDTQATLIAAGSAILASSLAGLVAHLGGGFRDLDTHDR